MSGDVLPFADSAAIVRAHQKDAYIEQVLLSKIARVLQLTWGQRLVNAYPQEISVAVKTLYLALTTVIGARTLGEEYVDILYVNRSGQSIPHTAKRLAFLGSYAILPYIIRRLAHRLQRLRPQDADRIALYSSWAVTMSNIHTALFYLGGQFYSVSKRVWGMRYASGHIKQSDSPKGNYDVLGVLILARYAVQAVFDHSANSASQSRSVPETPGVITSLESLRNSEPDMKIDLNDPEELPYIEGRSCMLCLSSMVDPSAAMCGHIFCWTCILDWVRDRPECPLCRQLCLPQHILPLR